MAGLGGEIIPDLSALSREWVRIVDRVEPNPDHAERYDALYALYLDLYAQTKETMHQLGRIAAW
ncbi:MAG: hypothetical protein H0V37_10130 [Chloroflexia bacterium]|nr:hypothetical protein [Chloroflexia bacterium]